MKNPIFLLFFFIAFGCDDSAVTETKQSTQPKTENTKSTTEKISSVIAKKACESISEKELSGILGWPVETIKKNDNTFTKDMTICQIYSGEEKLFVRLADMNEASQKNKVLEKRFDEYLTKGEKTITYKETSAGNPSQTIFGTGDGRGGTKIYVYRKRMQNSSEIHLEITSKTNAAADFQSKLEEISNLIQN